MSGRVTMIATTRKRKPRCQLCARRTWHGVCSRCIWRFGR